jgi:hypothetical protein
MLRISVCLTVPTPAAVCVPRFVLMLSFVDALQQSGPHLHQRRQSSINVMLHVLSSPFRISDPPTQLTPYDQRRNEYPSKYRRLPSQRIVCVPPEFVLLLVRLCLPPCDDKLIDWPCAAFVTWQGPCCGRP